MSGIGRAFTIMVKQYPKPDAYHNWPHSYGWWFGTAYEYGMLAPRYPMPALITQVEWSSKYGPEVWVWNNVEWTTPINAWFI